jgi:hypothetical protein
MGQLYAVVRPTIIRMLEHDHPHGKYVLPKIGRGLAVPFLAAPLIVVAIVGAPPQKNRIQKGNKTLRGCARWGLAKAMEVFAKPYG